MSASDSTEVALFDPKYSFLALSGSRVGHGAQYLDAATGWLAPWPWPAVNCSPPRRPMAVETEGRAGSAGVR